MTLDEAKKIASVWTDGACKGNPGPSGLGIVIVGYLLFEELSIPVREPITNNEAEYRALLYAVRYLKEHRPEITTVEFHSDSKLMVEQINGHWHTAHPTMVHLKDVIIEELSTFDQWTLVHIPRETNTAADALAKDASERAARGEE